MKLSDTRKKKVKIYCDNSCEKLEDKVNGFIAKCICVKVIDIKYSSTSCLNTNQIIYSAMIIFEV